MTGMRSCYFCIKDVSETDQAEGLKKMDVPTLILHDDQEQIVRIGNAALVSKVCKDAPHGFCTTYKDQINQSLPEFSKS